MAVLANLETSYGEVRELYVRVNSVTASNHGVESVAMLRGFISREAYEEGKSYVYEDSLEFSPDISKPLWSQVYEEYCNNLGIDCIEY